MSEFYNSYLHTTVEVGRIAADRADTVARIRGDRVDLILIESGQVRMYLDLETAASLADAIQAAVNNDVPVGDSPPLEPLHAKCSTPGRRPLPPTDRRPGTTKENAPGGNQGRIQHNRKNKEMSKHSLAHMYRDSVVYAYGSGIVTGATIALAVVFLFGGAR